MHDCTLDDEALSLRVELDRWWNDMGIEADDNVSHMKSYNADRMLMNLKYSHARTARRQSLPSNLFNSFDLPLQPADHQSRSTDAFSLSD